MTLQPALHALEKKALLSTAWIFVLLNMLFRDIHEVFRPGMLEELLTASAVGEGMMLVGGLMVELPIAMVLLSRLLPHAANRWLNVGAGLLMMATVVAFNLSPNWDDVLFMAAELLGLALIVWTAWRWRAQPD